jgi:hypothetical protein
MRRIDQRHGLPLGWVSPDQSFEILDRILEFDLELGAKLTRNIGASSDAGVPFANEGSDSQPEGSARQERAEERSKDGGWGTHESLKTGIPIHGIGVDHVEGGLEGRFEAQEFDDLSIDGRRVAPEVVVDDEANLLAWKDALESFDL